MRRTMRMTKPIVLIVAPIKKQEIPEVYLPH